MPEYLSPGVYIEEQNKGTRPIEGVGTAMAAFVGFAPSGEPNKPHLITNWTQYVNTFGKEDAGGRKEAHMDGTYLSHSVFGYFSNGGNRCYVVRVLPPANSRKIESKPLTLPSATSDAIASLKFTPKIELASDVKIEVTPAAGEGVTPEQFTVKITYPGLPDELYPNVTLKPSGNAKGAPNQTLVVDAVNKASQILTVAEVAGTQPLAERLPKHGTYLMSAPSSSSLVPKVQTQDFAGRADARSGVHGLEVAEDVTMVACPDLMSVYNTALLEAKQAEQDGKPAAEVETIKTDARNFVKAVQVAMITHCENMGDRVALIDPLPDLTPQEVKVWRERETNYDSKYAALYYPWIKIDGPSGKPMAVPPGGHMAGVYARNDNERGVHKAPANEVVRGAIELAMQSPKASRTRSTPSASTVSAPSRAGASGSGARGRCRSDPAWRYVNVRRLFNYVEKSIERGTQWVVFEPNDMDLWARVRRDVSAFLTGCGATGCCSVQRRPRRFTSSAMRNSTRRSPGPGPVDHRDRDCAGEAGGVRDLPYEPVVGRRRVTAVTAHNYQKEKQNAR